MYFVLEKVASHIERLLFYHDSIQLMHINILNVIPQVAHMDA